MRRLGSNREAYEPRAQLKRGSAKVDGSCRRHARTLPGVSKPIIEQHEEAASVAFTGVVVLGVAALAGLLLFLRGKRVPAWYGFVMLAASLIVDGLMAWVANLDGQVRHTEIRSSASPPAVIGDKNHE